MNKVILLSNHCGQAFLAIENSECNQEYHHESKMQYLSELQNQTKVSVTKCQDRKLNLCLYKIKMKLILPASQ